MRELTEMPSPSEAIQATGYTPLALVAIRVVGYVITLFALRVYFCCGLFTRHFLFFVGVSDSR